MMKVLGKFVMMALMFESKVILTVGRVILLAIAVEVVVKIMMALVVKNITIMIIL